MGDGTPYVKRRWTVEHTWICSACQKTNRGRDLKCVHCGKPKEASEKYDESNAASKPAVTDVKAISESKRGVNWTCEYCRYENRGDLGACGKCGAEHGGPPPAAVTSPPTPIEPISDACIAEPEGRTHEIFRRVQQSRTPILVALGCVVVIGALIWGGIWLFTPWQEHVTVTAAHWSRTAVLQQRVTRDGEGWGSPVGAFNVNCERRQHGTHECNPYRCNPHDVSYECRCHMVSAGESCHEHCSSGGNGFSECEEVCTPHTEEECDTCNRTEYDTCYEQCPTYDDWCEYQYYDWPDVRQENTSGSDANPVVWPALAVDPNPPSPQRIVRTEDYRITFHNANDTWHYAPSDEHDFGRFHRNAPWMIEVTHAGTVRPLNTGTEVASR